MKTLYDTKEHSRNSTVIRKGFAWLGRKKQFYRLLATENTFYVKVFAENGIGIVKSLGKDLDVAEWIFDLLVEHTVSLCHLCEIVEELLEDRSC